MSRFIVALGLFCIAFAANGQAPAPAAIPAAAAAAFELATPQEGAAVLRRAMPI